VVLNVILERKRVIFLDILRTHFAYKLLEPVSNNHLDLIFQNFLVIVLNFIHISIFFVDEQRNILNQERKIFLRGIVPVQPRHQASLFLSVKYEVDYRKYGQP
jgi:hypothetical protein